MEFQVRHYAFVSASLPDCVGVVAERVPGEQVHVVHQVVVSILVLEVVEVAAHHRHALRIVVFREASLTIRVLAGSNVLGHRDILIVLHGIKERGCIFALEAIIPEVLD